MPRTRAAHLDFEDHVSLAQSGILDGQKRAHLTACATCQAESAEVGGIVTGMRDDDAVEPAARLVRATLAAFPQKPPRRARLVEMLARLCADIASPSQAFGREPFAVRGDAVVNRMRYEAPGVEVELEVATTASGLRATGQMSVAGDRELPAVIWAERSGRMLRQAPIGEQGVFSVDELPSTRFDLVFDLAEHRLRLPIEIGGHP